MKVIKSYSIYIIFFFLFISYVGYKYLEEGKDFESYRLLNNANSVDLIHVLHSRGDYFLKKEEDNTWLLGKKNNFKVLDDKNSESVKNALGNLTYAERYAGKNDSKYGFGKDSILFVKFYSGKHMLGELHKGKLDFVNDKMSYTYFKKPNSDSVFAVQGYFENIFRIK